MPKRRRANTAKTYGNVCGLFMYFDILLLVCHNWKCAVPSCLSSFIKLALISTTIKLPDFILSQDDLTTKMEADRITNGHVWIQIEALESFGVYIKNYLHTISIFQIGAGPGRYTWDRNVNSSCMSCVVLRFECLKVWVFKRFVRNSLSIGSNQANGCGVIRKSQILAQVV